MFFVRAAFWIFVILLLMPTTDKEKSDFYTAASRTVSDFGSFCVRNPDVCDQTGAIFETILRKVRTTVEMLEDMVQAESPRRDAGSPAPRNRESEHRSERGDRSDLIVGSNPTPARSQHTLRPTDLQPVWRGPGGI